jgi:nucleoside-diphosphate-sugar epimerase
VKRVLVTGANGFVGRHCLAPLAAAGFEVHAISRAGTGPDGPCWHRADLLDSAAVSALVDAVRPTHLLHLAWYTTHRLFWTAPENLAWVRGSLALVEAFARADGRRAVLAGTCAEYDPRFGFCSEGVTPLAPATLYGTSKHALHLVAEAFASGNGVSLAWARLFFLYGPGEPAGRFVPAVVAALLRGEPALLTHGNQVRDFLAVGDVADALVALLDSPVEGPVNVASGVPTSLRDLATSLAGRLGRPDLLRFGAVPAPPGESPFLVADVRRLKEEVAWSPRRDPNEGPDATVAWWKARLAEEPTP